MLRRPLGLSRMKEVDMRNSDSLEARVAFQPKVSDLYINDLASSQSLVGIENLKEEVFSSCTNTVDWFIPLRGLRCVVNQFPELFVCPYSRNATQENLPTVLVAEFLLYSLSSRRQREGPQKNPSQRYQSTNSNGV